MQYASQTLGFEIEYMIVHKETLDVLPYAEKLLAAGGGQDGDVRGEYIDWSNELTAHLIELKAHSPTAERAQLDTWFHEAVQTITHHLAAYDAILLPTGAHPWMKPSDTKLWSQGSFVDVYALYERHFGCSSNYGWVNVQSMHINFPFATDAEFSALHGAIRAILPLLPALAASSPYYDGAHHGWQDERLMHYKQHQQHITSTMGKVIPEQVFTEADYESVIFAPIQQDIDALQGSGLLRPYFFNARGAIARFERGSVEIRLLDTQECPLADCAIACLVEATVNLLRQEELSTFSSQAALGTDRLATILWDVAKQGQPCKITDKDYLNVFAMNDPVTANEWWRIMLARTEKSIPPRLVTALQHILDQGTLSKRLLQRIGTQPTHSALHTAYTELATCLQTNTQF